MNSRRFRCIDNHANTRVPQHRRARSSSVMSHAALSTQRIAALH